MTKINNMLVADLFLQLAKLNYRVKAVRLPNSKETRYTLYNEDRQPIWSGSFARLIEYISSCSSKLEQQREYERLLLKYNRLN